MLQLGALAITQGLANKSVSLGAQLLTPVETQVFQSLANGLSPQEIAQAEATSVSTVRKQLESAKKRLGAQNMPHAVALAMELNQIFEAEARIERSLNSQSHRAA